MDQLKKTDNLIYKLFLGLLGLLLLCGLSFYGGIHYQKGKQVTPTASTSRTLSGGGFAGRFGGQRPSIGTVTTVSATSITIQNNFTSSAQTFSIDSSTQISNNGQPATVADIQSGATVFIRASSSNSSVASQILLNPGFGSGSGAPSSTNSVPST